jgi:uncharacterized protein (DUF2235 family)
MAPTVRFGRVAVMKHLVYLIDGTWLYSGRVRNGGTYSNVHKLNSHLHYDDNPKSLTGKPKNPQIVHYTRGLGNTKYWWNRYSSGGFGYGISEAIQDVYLNICSNYQNGDKIYLFGFSRGAVVARAVCALLGLGVLEPKHIDVTIDVFKTFKLLSVIGLPAEIGRKIPQDISDLIQRIHAHSVHPRPAVEFLGLFDTVIGGQKLTREMQELSIIPSITPANARNVVHLLAIDERRRFFLPHPFVGRHPQATDQNLEQIWLPGVHGDIGGGSGAHTLAAFAELLMIDRVHFRCDLRFDTDTLENQFFVNGELRFEISDEMSNGPWWLDPRGGTQRKVNGYHAYVHPLADWLVTRYTLMRGRGPVPYPIDHLEDIVRCEAFLSPRFRGKSLQW